jgi:YbbR domain-containing protein
MVQKDKQELMITILSIFIAFVLWLYVMGDKNPVQTKVVENIPVMLVNTENIPQADLALLPNQNFTVNLTVTGRALDIFNVATSDFVVEADMGGYLKRGDNNIPVEIKSPPRGITVVNKNGYPYIRVKLDSLADKSVPVVVNVVGNAKEGYHSVKPVLRPTEALISGPATYVNSVYTLVGQIDITGNYANLNGSIPLKPQDKDGKEVKYVTVEPKIVDVTIDIKPSKEVPIVVKTIGEISNNILLKSITPKIDSVVIVGDSEVIDKISKIETSSYNLSRLTSTVTRELTLNIPEGVSIVNETKSVSVDFIVEGKIEKNLTIDLDMINRNDQYSYSTSSNNVVILLYGPESIIKSIQEDSLGAYVDLNNIIEGEHVVSVKLNVPDSIHVKNYTPEKVTVTVTKK